MENINLKTAIFKQSLAELIRQVELPPCIIHMELKEAAAKEEYHYNMEIKKEQEAAKKKDID